MKLHKVVSTDSAILYEGCPWGDDIMLLLALYNVKSRVGGYILLPRFCLGSSVVSPKIIGASIKELTIASKCLYNTSLEDFIDRMKYIISISSIDREYADEYSLVFDNTLITRHYIEDDIVFYKNTRRVLRFFFAGAHAFADRCGSVNACSISYV